MQKTEHKSVRKGDVWLIENVQAVGHVQKGVRPHVVVTQVTGQTVTVSPCSAVQKRSTQKYVVKLEPTAHSGLKQISFVLLAQSFAADISLLEKKIGTLSADEIARIQLEYVKYVTE